MKFKSLVIAFVFSAATVSSSSVAQDHDHGHDHHHHHEKPSMESKAHQLPGGSLYHLNSDWKDSSGQRFNLKDLGGKVRIAAMLYTSCDTACPMIIKDMKSILEKLPNEVANQIEMTVFSFDPNKDTPQRLSEFSKKMKMPDSKWKLLTASQPGDVTELANSMGVQFKKIEGGHFIHSNVIFLLNAKGEIETKKEGLMTPAEEFIAAVKAHFFKNTKKKETAKN